MFMPWQWAVLMAVFFCACQTVTAAPNGWCENIPGQGECV